MATIAICCNVLLGVGTRNIESEGRLLLVIPFAVSISFFLIADIDSPAGVLYARIRKISLALSNLCVRNNASNSPEK